MREAHEKEEREEKVEREKKEQMQMQMPRETRGEKAARDRADKDAWLAQTFGMKWNELCNDTLGMWIDAIEADCSEDEWKKKFVQMLQVDRADLDDNRGMSLEEVRQLAEPHKVFVRRVSSGYDRV